MLFTKEEGVEEHCQMGAILISNTRIFDWMGGIAMKGKAGEGIQPKTAPESTRG